jgi:hypothetical protein
MSKTKYRAMTLDQYAKLAGIRDFREAIADALRRGLIVKTAKGYRVPTKAGRA